MLWWTVFDDDDDGTAESDVGITLSEVMDDPAEFYGERVVISGEVNEVVSPDSFTIGGDEFIGVAEPLLVVGATDIPTIGERVDGDAVLENDTVQVDGRVREFIIAEVEDDDDELYIDYEQEPDNDSGIVWTRQVDDLFGSRLIDATMRTIASSPLASERPLNQSVNAATTRTASASPSSVSPSNSRNTSGPKNACTAIMGVGPHKYSITERSASNMPFTPRTAASGVDSWSGRRMRSCSRLGWPFPARRYHRYGSETPLSRSINDEAVTTPCVQFCCTVSAIV